MKIKFKKTRKGMSLIELFISIAILLIGMEGFTLLFARSLKSNSYVLEMGQVSMAASQGVNKLVRYIREIRQGDDGSYPVVLAKDNELTVYCDYDHDGVTERLHFYQDGSNLIMGTRDPSGFPVTYASGDAQTQIIVTHIVNSASNPIFAYYDSQYPEDSENNPVSTPASVPNVRLIRVVLHININPFREPDNIQIQSFAEIRNLNDHDRYGL